jgi:sarcosine oxidase, subunit beta
LHFARTAVTLKKSLCVSYGNQENLFMNETADCIVIGGGVMGASIAYQLASQGMGRVVLLERLALGNGTTGRSGAIVRQHYSNDFTIRMARESLQVFTHFADVVGGDCGFVTTGMLVVVDDVGTSTLRASVVLQQALGVDTRLISPQEVSAAAPGYSGTGAALACYEAEAGVADPMATTHCFASRAREHGATIREGVTVTRISTSGARVTGVETDQGSVVAPIVVLAANAWSVGLAREIGIALPITPTRHPMLALRRPDDSGGRYGWHAVCLDMTHAIYMRPEIGGVTLVGSTEEVPQASDPDAYQQGLTEAEIAHFHATGSIYLPALARAVPRGGWAGIYDDTPDAHPILGRLAAYDGLYCAAGFSGHGFKLSPLVGQWMARLITTGETPDDMRPFAFERFEKGEPIHLHYPSGVLG